MNRSAIENYASLTVFAVPPSINHYVKHTRKGIHYKTREAKQWENDLALACLGAGHVVANTFDVAVTVCLGPGQRGDVDNFLKLILDVIARRGILVSPKGKQLSDSHVHRVTVQKVRSDEPRTFIFIKPFEKG